MSNGYRIKMKECKKLESTKNLSACCEKRGTWKFKSCPYQKCKKKKKKTNNISKVTADWNIAKITNYGNYKLDKRGKWQICDWDFFLKLVQKKHYFWGGWSIRNCAKNWGFIKQVSDRFIKRTVKKRDLVDFRIQTDYLTVSCVPCEIHV